MSVVGVLILLATARQKIDSAVLFIQVLNTAHRPGAGCQLVLKLPCCQVVKIEVVPTVALRGTKDLVAGFDEAKRRLAGIHVVVGMLLHQGLLLPGFSIDGTELDRFIASLSPVVAEALAVGEPDEAGSALEWNVERRGLHFNPLSGRHLKDNGRRLSQHLARQWIHIGESFRAKLVRRNELKAG